MHASLYIADAAYTPGRVCGSIRVRLHGLSHSREGGRAGVFTCFTASSFFPGPLSFLVTPLVLSELRVLRYIYRWVV